ncbi:peptidyl-prolyl cis-trans isomerase CYP59-like isoform X1 [Elaeis guineensis]|uniref:peptidyl-prolyl cis-trans isomerase CYP59-like isoform X1 n=1 Tax=Elaeis guineensis var. tenera TaxID=51953 RepID=UPI003C6D6AC2
MSVLIVTSLGDIVVDLHTDRCPLTTKNFLKLCKMKYYNGCLFHKVEKDFLAQAGDRTGTGTGGDSVYKFLYGDQARFFEDEIHPDLKHSKTGTVAMASAGKNLNASQFYFTLRDDLDYLDEKHTVFGIVEEKEGLDTLAKINEAYVDDQGRPFKDIRIKHTYILDDPFDDPPQLAEFIPEKSPEGKPHDEIADERLEDNWVPFDETLAPEELEEVIRAKEAHTNAAILESVGDIPDAEMKPPDNVLFVCKLNPVTQFNLIQDEDLYTIFSRFGNVTSAEIIRDYKTGDSLCYAFIEFETKEACERAYFKMDNTLIDDRRIHVDFSQSVAKLWSQYRHGKRSHTNKDGCFKCGAPDHFAQDCDQRPDNRQRGPKYVLKDDNMQHGGDNHQRYDMLFDEDNMDSERGRQEQMKKCKTDHHNYEHSTGRGYDKKDSERQGHDDNGSRRIREYESNQGSKRHHEHLRYEDKEHRRRHDSSRHRNDGDNRSSGSGWHENDRSDGDWHRKDGRDHQKRSKDSDKHRKDDRYSDRKSRDRHYESYKERRHGDDRRK